MKKMSYVRLVMLLLFVLVAVSVAGCSSQDGADKTGTDGKNGTEVTGGAEITDAPEVTSEVKITDAPETTPKAEVTDVPELTPEITPEATPEATPEITPGVTETPSIAPELLAEAVRIRLDKYYDEDLIYSYGQADEEILFYYDSNSEWPEYSGSKGKSGLMGKMFLDYDGDGIDELLTARTECTNGYISVYVLLYQYDVATDSIRELTQDMLVSPAVGEGNYSLQGSYRIADDGLYVYFTYGETFDLHEGGFCGVAAAAYRLNADDGCAALFSERCYVEDFSDMNKELAKTKKYMPSIFEVFNSIRRSEVNFTIDENTPAFTPLSRTDGAYTDIFTWQLMKQKDKDGYNTSVDPLYTFYMWYGENGMNPWDRSSVNYPSNGYTAEYFEQEYDDDWEFDHTYGYGLKTDLPYDPPYTEYIIIDSSFVELTRNSVAFLTKEELRLARNEIYARHGRMFSSKNLQDYFNSCSWYEPIYSADSFNDEWLNEVEKKNIKLLKELEDSKS